MLVTSSSLAKLPLQRQTSPQANRAPTVNVGAADGRPDAKPAQEITHSVARSDQRGGTLAVPTRTTPIASGKIITAGDLSFRNQQAVDRYQQVSHVQLDGQELVNRLDTFA